MGGSQAPYRVFLSSTSTDLEAHRDRVRRVIEGLGQRAIAMEVFAASPDTPFDECMKRVDDCDALVVLVAHRYGWIPKKAQGGDGEKSITWHEVDRAMNAEKPVFAFLVEKDAAWDGPKEQDRLEDENEDPREVGKAVRSLQRFRDHLSSEVTLAKFTSPDSAAAEASMSLATWLIERAGLEVGGDADSAPATDVGSYLAAVATLHDTIEIAGFGTKLRAPIRLEDMYVPLHATIDVRATGEARMGSAGEAGDDFGDSHEIPLTEAFVRAKKRGSRRGLVILGDPGSGKTTHLKRLLVWIAERGAEGLGLPAETVPVFLPFRDLRDEDVGAGLDAFLQSQLDGHPHIDVEAGFAKSLLKRGKLLFLLDGLDEIPDVESRQKVVAWVEEAVKVNHDSRFVVTCRYAGYKPLEEQFSSRFLELHLRPLNEDQANEFVNTWFRIVETGLSENEAQAKSIAKERAAELLAKLKEKRTDTSVFEMTRNPLLLTGLCLVHRDRGGLPERRADLYDESIDVLLERWQQKKKLKVSIPAKKARRLLQPVAYWMHSEKNRIRAAGKDLEPIVDEAMPRVGLAELSGAEFLERIESESGLITGWGDDSYGFMHLGFQEYLAAQHVGTQFLKQPGLIAELAGRFGESWWREITVLLLGLDGVSLLEPLMEQVTRLPAFATNESLVRECILHTAEFAPEPFVRLLREEGEGEGLWARQVVAVRILREHAPEELEGLAEALAKHTSADVRALFTPEKARVATGTIRAERGEFELVLIRGGTFRMGSKKREQARWAEDKDDKRWFAEESPDHEVELADFYLGKYPVTNEQYRRFMEAEGAPEPENWGDKRYNQPNQPVVGVSWDEAQAYCKWAGLVLPTEAQWEYACRAGTTTAFWSGDDEADLERVGWYAGNSGGELHPVGEKPANPFGLFDVHGNVFEWCLDWHGDYKKKPRPGDGARHLEGGSFRVFRGGSFGGGARVARSACRDGGHPGGRWPGLGFRPARPHP